MDVLVFLSGMVVGAICAFIGCRSALRSLEAPRKGWEQYAKRNGLPVSSHE